MMLSDDNPFKAYKKNAVEARVAGASPHQLIAMLIERGLEEIDKAEGFMVAGQLDKKGDAIAKSLDILHALDSALDLANGGELAENLHQLYDFCSRRLMEISLRNQPELFDEVRAVLKPLQEGWMGAQD